MAILNIGKDFSDYPSGRYRCDGDSSAESFREDYLKNALNSLADNEKLCLVLDNVEAYSAAFLRDSFEPLIASGFISAEKLLSVLEFSYTDPDFSFYEERIKFYINDTKVN